MRLCEHTMRATLMWMSVDVVSGVRIVQCQATMNVVIDVIIDVVIGVRVMLCHQAEENSGFSTFLNFPLRVQILILLSSCINSSSLFRGAILCTLLNRENTSFEVWYLQTPSVTVDRRHLYTIHLYQSKLIQENHALMTCFQILV